MKTQSHPLVQLVSTLALGLGLMLGLVVTEPGCALMTKENAKTVLDFASIGCIILNAELPDEKVATTCDIIDKLIPSMKELLSQQRAASRKYAASKAGNCSTTTIVFPPAAGDAGK